MSSERRVVHYRGRVQGVGFRFTACHVARRYPVNGYVQNLKDGRVRLVVEGETQELDRLLGELQSAMDRYIVDVVTETAAATGEFSDFEIRY